MAVVFYGAPAGVTSLAAWNTDGCGAYCGSAITRVPCSPYAEKAARGSSATMNVLFDTADFLRRARRRMRYGDFSRSPVQLLRLEWKECWAECDWLMRAADPWDSVLPANLSGEHETLQAFRDALSLRNLIFESFQELNRAELRMFRAIKDHQPELLMTGSLKRSDEVLPRVASVAMQAKLCGFRFSLTEGVLESMTPI
jgi:hypothetical protein